MSELGPFEPFLDELAERVAAKLANELEGRQPAPDAGEPWRLLTLKEAAARLGRSERWLRERAKRGDVAHVRLDGGALAFDVDDLREFARARRVGGR